MLDGSTGRAVPAAMRWCALIRRLVLSAALGLTTRSGRGSVGVDNARNADFVARAPVTARSAGR
jgi:hypothetical protein